MKLKMYISVFVTFALFLVTCDKSPNNSNGNKIPIFTGDVKESDGAAVANVGVHFIFFDFPMYPEIIFSKINTDFTLVVPKEFFLYQNFPNPFSPQTVIQFQIPVATEVNLSIYNYPEGDSIRTLIDETLQAGVHSYIWDGKNENKELVTNGLYLYRLKTNSFEKENLMCINILDSDHLKLCKARYHTDENGRFEIEYKNIPIGTVFNHTDETNPELLGQLAIPDSITIVLTKEGYQNIIQKVRIDTTKYVEYDFVMKN